MFLARAVRMMDAEKKRVLIVDDEEDLTWSISKRLIKDKNHLEIICANSGNRALDMLSNYQVDLIVTDLRMPGISGIQLVDEVRSHHPYTQVIVMTAYGCVEVKRELDKMGRMGYIEKPFEMCDLRDLIYEYLNINP